MWAFLRYDNYIKGNPFVASVGCDNQEGFDLAVKHLTQLGHKKIGLISGPSNSYIMKARYNAYLSAMEKYGLEINEDYIGIGYYVAESTRKYIPRLVNQGVTAILFSHDIRAISALTECDDRNISVPKDLSIIGFDDLPMTEYTQPPLTTIRQDRIALGKCGYYAMTFLLNDVPIGNIQLRATLVVRSSTGPVPTVHKTVTLTEADRIQDPNPLNLSPETKAFFEAGEKKESFRIIE